MPIFDGTPEADAIAQRMIAAIDFKSDKPSHILAACANAITFCLSLTCARCRAAVADELRQHIPQMLADADELAADAAPTEHRHLQ